VFWGAWIVWLASVAFCFSVWLVVGTNAFWWMDGVVFYFALARWDLPWLAASQPHRPALSSQRPRGFGSDRTYVKEKEKIGNSHFRFCLGAFV
jgi:hypothetical protein